MMNNFSMRGIALSAGLLFSLSVFAQPSFADDDEDKHDDKDNQVITIVGPQGPAGADGAPGVAGPAGPKGDSGAQGPTGLTGAAGSQGIPGNDGASIVGPAGQDGAAGAQGPAGQDGLPGLAGPSGDPHTQYIPQHLTPAYQPSFYWGPEIARCTPQKPHILSHAVSCHGLGGVAFMQVTNAHYDLLVAGVLPGYVILHCNNPTIPGGPVPQATVGCIASPYGGAAQ